MSDFFRGRRAVVTGSAQGIGYAIAGLLGARGVDLLLLDVNEEVGARAAAGIGGAGERRFQACDVASDDAVRAASIVAKTAWGSIDFLINNAGIFPRTATCDMSEADWRRTIDTNLGGAFRCVKHFVPLMAGRAGAAVVNISSGRAFEGAADGAAYAASKAGIIGLTKSWAREFAARGIRVNTLVPGVTDTAQPRQVLSTEQLMALGAHIPLGRIGEPVDIARGVIFLLSDEAGYMTGQSLIINGGSITP